MWTKADAWHAHAISGAAYTALGAGLMVEWAAEDVAALASGGGTPPPVDATLVGVALALATTCAFTGVPLSKKRGWRKTELSARSIAFQTVLTWECARFGGVVDPALGHVPILDAFALAFVPFVWQTITSAYIALATEDDKRAAFAVREGLDEPRVVARHENAARKFCEAAHEGVDGLEVQVVRRLVEEQAVRPTER